ncbi:MAG: hypothetical protein GKR93_02315 [Gammaproteobacteria bacterium]|nr:hypothetical protein [Gammaproteobacteria bacterium]
MFKAVTLLKFFLLSTFFAVTLAAQTTTPEEHIRGQDQTFLTYPEWFLVHSPTEYASFLETQKPGNFPWFGHVGQFWQSYESVFRRVKDVYPFNGEYHVMLMTIGVSTTVEYAVKGLYEFTIGRLTEAISSNRMTDEDRVAYEEATLYAEFILRQPWYEFDYLGSLRKLWFETSFFDRDIVRKLERKYILTSEYLIKAFYAWLIEQGAAASFDAPLHKTAVVTAEGALNYFPRYRPFTHEAVSFANTGGNFIEIAGNRESVVLSLLTTANWNAESIMAKTLFTQAIITVEGQSRHVIELKVKDLAEALRSIELSKLQLEHIYDY